MEIRKVNGKTLFIKGRKEGILVGKDDIPKNKFNYRVVLCTDNYCDSSMSGDKVVIAAPGEYEVGGVEYLGINGGEGKTVYVIDIDGVSVGVIGSIQEPLTDKRVERINEMDVLLLSLDRGDKVDLKMVMGWVKKWGANYLIPYNYESEEVLKKFLDEVDYEGAEAVDVLKVDRDILPEGMEVVVLKNVI